jgi:hypothetical protein
MWSTHGMAIPPENLFFCLFFRQSVPKSGCKLCNQLIDRELWIDSGIRRKQRAVEHIQVLYLMMTSFAIHNALLRIIGVATVTSA